jgi:hypothetical protein
MDKRLLSACWEAHHADIRMRPLAVTGSFFELHPRSPMITFPFEQIVQFLVSVIGNKQRPLVIVTQRFRSPGRTSVSEIPTIEIGLGKKSSHPKLVMQ